MLNRICIIVFTPSDKPISIRVVNNYNTSTTTNKSAYINFLYARHSSEHFININLFKQQPCEADMIINCILQTGKLGHITISCSPH